jgi:hypothetical protein
MDFERARRVAVRTMRTAAWRDAIQGEDATMVEHIPQLTRINKLGMITWNSQSGRASRYLSKDTGQRELKAQRAYCVGFLTPQVADALIKWMWLYTDKYVARMGLADATTDRMPGTIGVTYGESGRDVWDTTVSPFFMAMDRNCNYPDMIFKTASTPMRVKARAQIGEYLKDPVPDTAVAVLFVAMRWGRKANAQKGLFTEIERGLAQVAE